MGCKQDEDTDSLVLHSNQECRADKNHDGSLECEAIDDCAKSRKAAEPSTCMNNSTARDRVESLTRQHQQTFSSPVTSCSSSRRTKVALTKRLRQRGTTVSYVEPKLNTKLRRGDYYGLGKQIMQSNKHRCRSKHCAGADTRCTGAASRPNSFNQQFSPFHRRRAMRSVTRGVSYAEPKLNTKLRRGDKFTFTT
uniref:Shugoshin C-terminal domain-containing protein n=1 Tax=Hyaloperonospora arabidopsidis (strain Emoy2) TaxID=559515 RepID=M4BQ41_HYAAE